MPYHFGLKVIEGKRGLKLTRDKYAIVSNKNSFGVRFSRDIYADEAAKVYKDEWCETQLRDCLENYDLNMKYFSSLDHNEFNKEVEEFLKNNKDFTEVVDLNLYEGISGYYLMILDEYSQLYVGTSYNIKNRIRQHWNKSKQFDRLLFPMGNVDSSKLSIDSFRALDTTRIYVHITEDTYSKEDDYINQFSSEFIANRMSGGKIEGGLIQAISMMKTRDL
ncbi:hypothetical protein AAHH67_15540 [Niallia circulans]